MSPGDRGVLTFVNRDNQVPHRLVMTVKRADGGRCQLKVLTPVLPYPAVWDCRKLLGLHEVWFEVARTGRVLKGRPSGAAGGNLSLDGLADDVMPQHLR